MENAMTEPCRKYAFAADNICSDCNKLSPLKFGRPRTVCRQVHHENWNRPSPGRNWGSDNVNVPSVAVKDETVMRRVWRRMTGVFDPEREGRAAPPDMSSRLEPAYSVEIGPNDVGITPHKARALHRADQALGGQTLGPVAYQAPVFAMESQGSAGPSDSPFWRISIEMPSGERTKAIWPSRGGRLIVTPLSISFWQVA